MKKIIDGKTYICKEDFDKAMDNVMKQFIDKAAEAAAQSGGSIMTSVMTSMLLTAEFARLEFDLFPDECEKEVQEIEKRQAEERKAKQADREVKGGK